MSTRAGLPVSRARKDRSGFWRAKATLAAIVLCAAASPALAEGLPPADAFAAFVVSFRTDAVGQGIGGALYDETFRDLRPDPTVAAMTQRQPEEVKPLGAYLAAQVTAGRITEGQAMLKRWSVPLAAIEREFGVPAGLIVAIWGLETNYGTARGGKDVIRSLATLAASGYRPDLVRAELVAALHMLQDAGVPRASLRGSWAGAMGQPQFMPSSFLRFAVDQDGDTRRDIWSSVPDSLASIAHFISQQGWQTGQPWGFEVDVPSGFDRTISRAPFGDWAAAGVRRADGTPMPGQGTGILYYPAGSSGPGFLVTGNFEVLKTYNFSDAYALSVGELADRMAGGGAIRALWPSEPPMSRVERIALQARLLQLGFTVDNREGRISLVLRDVIRKAQASVGMMPDGNPTRDLLRRLATN